MVQRLKSQYHRKIVDFRVRTLLCRFRWIALEEKYFSRFWGRVMSRHSEAEEYLFEVGEDEAEALDAAKKLDKEEYVGHEDVIAVAAIHRKNRALKQNIERFFNPKVARVWEQTFPPSNKKFPLKSLKGSIPNIPKMYFGKKIAWIRTNLLPQPVKGWLLGIL